MNQNLSFRLEYPLLLYFNFNKPLGQGYLLSPSYRRLQESRYAIELFDIFKTDYFQNSSLSSMTDCAARQHRWDEQYS